MHLHTSRTFARDSSAKIQSSLVTISYQKTYTTKFAKPVAAIEFVVQKREGENLHNYVITRTPIRLEGEVEHDFAFLSMGQLG